MSALDYFKKTALEEATRTIDQMNDGTFEKAAQLIWDAQAKGNRIHITGIGKPAHVAEYMASLLSDEGL